uniref:Small ribosomal subunit protein uS15c n=3 Tax=Cuscuta subgen. Grammica TaxID=1824618 RepID=RR15_CUSGR|nr:ribosomal protein S15 [Cuscuta gronovii]YP_009996261.1 ribosomal protein S15 [Cuscuta campestris]A7M943.1 RecName: Full=Small ribosomal subunit protein uS15c; AltName: Full=30S ribosomal protein S15, plastid [Cuscuta gronovii]QNQ65389.1 ribosomal protein S15 [Cuscuta campestris]QPJ79504.1 ribosomal protein S15 [Cuscuta gronovii]WCF05563.1 ribosomal protein S15 [Cuscuta gronovii]WNN67066.1 ribosomal protein S15 [Cuscuta gronovii]CAM98371.1 ribosomal protein S15 [Cuscuta gronovii]
MTKTIFISTKENTGSIEFQIVNFTKKICKLTDHLKLHKKDYLSQRGLRQMLGKRQRLLVYLSKINLPSYNDLILKLKIREAKKDLS